MCTVSEFVRPLTFAILIAYIPLFLCQVGEEYYDSSEEQSTLEPLTLPPAPIGGYGYHLPYNFGSGKDCFKKFPHLKERFSWEQLEFFCQQKRIYEAIIFNETDVPFTIAQKNWIESAKFKLGQTDGVTKVKRKEIRQLTRKEWRRFSNAIRSLKEKKIDGISQYDLIVMMSHPAIAPGALVGAAFLPWHRVYLRTLERVLQRYDPLNAIPYWDSTLDEALPNPQHSIVWTSLFFGNEYGEVINGPFRRFQFKADNETDAVSLVREAGKNGSLMTPQIIDFFLTRERYKDLTACTDLTVEQANRALHEWVGGSMASIYYAAQDPLTYPALAFMDYLWEQFRQTKQDTQQRTYDYPPNYQACTRFHFGRSEMKPFGPMKNIDGLNEVFTTALYSYEARPTCSREMPSCNSRYLYCDIEKEQCVSKIRLHADCSQFHPLVSPCFHAECVDGRCTRKRRPEMPEPSDANSLDPSSINKINKHKT